MILSQYIQWNEIWQNEIDLHLELEYIKSNSEDTRIEIIEQFLNDKNVCLNIEECELLDNDDLYFCFSEQGGQHEGDSVGWFRIYHFVFDKNTLKTVEYEQE